MWRFRHFLLVISFLILSPDTASPVNVDINSDIYGILQKLETEGLIRSSMLTTKPLSRQEIIRLILEAESNAENRSLFIRQLIKNLKERFRHQIDNQEFFKPIENPYLQYTYSDSDNADRVAYNIDGYDYEKGSNLRSGISSNADISWLSLHINPEIRSSDKNTHLFINKAYGILSIYGWELEFGKDSQWWGPGHHGAILLSNNADPFTIIKITNARPVTLPYVLKYLGLFKFSFFTTKLEEDRAVPGPFFWGMRINFKPNPYLEIGLNRTATLGGEGRSKDLKTWLKSFAGRGENTDSTSSGQQSGPGDQKGGIDLKLTLPFRRQPVQLYAEIAGEDEAGGLPGKKAYLSGVYLPRILNMERVDLRFEYSINHIERSPNVWYTHGVYRSGYTYKSRIIGHHMGTDSKDIFLEARYFLSKPDNGMISVSYNREKHNLSFKTNEISDEFSLKINLPLTKNLNIKTIFAFATIKDLNNIEGADSKINILTSYLTYKF